MNRKPKLLVIEDENAIVDILRINFALAGFEVHGCTHSPESMKNALVELPDIIFLDLLMPIQSGWDVLADLKANPVTQGIPVVILSVVKSTEAREMSARMGAAAHMAKPFDLTELVDLAKQLTGWKG